jgi:hypothetical protein
MVDMTSVNTNNLDQSIAKFQSLPAEEQLIVLGALFKEISGSIPLGSANSEEITLLVQQVQAQRQDEQIQTLGDILANQTAKDDQVALDPHPSQAMIELLPGNTQPALTRYTSLDPNARLVFWYQLGQQLSSTLPSDISSSEASEIFTSLRSLDTDQKAAFLSQIV